MNKISRSSVVKGYRSISRPILSKKHEISSKKVADKIEFSSHYKRALEDNGVRMDKVQEVKQKIQSGEYAVSSEQIARALLRDIPGFLID